jgi:hypothetical protein
MKHSVQKQILIPIIFLLFCLIDQQKLMAQYQRLETGRRSDVLFYSDQGRYSVVFPAYQLKHKQVAGGVEYEIGKNHFITMAYYTDKDTKLWPISASKYLELNGTMATNGIKVVTKKLYTSYEGDDFDYIATTEPCSNSRSFCYTYTATFTKGNKTAVIFIESTESDPIAFVDPLKTFNWAGNDQNLESKILGLASAPVPIRAYVIKDQEDGSLVFGFKEGGSKEIEVVNAQMTISKRTDNTYMTPELEKLAKKEMTGSKNVLEWQESRLGDGSMNAYTMFSQSHLIDKANKIYRFESIAFSPKGLKIHFFIDLKAEELISKKEAYKAKSLNWGAQKYYGYWLRRTLVSFSVY